MRKPYTLLSRFWKDESGAAAAEYALLLAVIAAGLAVAAGLLGTAISDAMNLTTDCINDQTTCPGAGGTGTGTTP